VEVAGEVQVDVLHRHDLRIAAAGRAALHAEARAERGFAQQIIAFLPMRLRPSPRPTVVVVLPSPAGVGLIAVTRISLPSFLPCALTCFRYETAELSCEIPPIRNVYSTNFGSQGRCAGMCSVITSPSRKMPSRSTQAVTPRLPAAAALNPLPRPGRAFSIVTAGS
jgi:hypothetical protein